MNNTTDNFITTIATISVGASESFVKNKRVGAGSGESRLYIGSQKSDAFGNFINFDIKEAVSANKKKYDACSCSCMLVKDNLLEYMNAAKQLYYNPTIDYQNKLSDLYEQRVDKVKSLTTFPRFIVFNQTGDTDSARLYLGSTSPHWQLIRELALPFVTDIQIDKLFDENTYETFYVFTLHLKSTNSASIVTDIHTAQNSEKKSTQQNAYQRKHEAQLHAINSDMSLTDTEKEHIVISRKGQGIFRNNTLALMPACPFTNINDSRLLRASHCIPWRECTTASDRLDGYNGLTLTPTYDLLFDQGFISFDENGCLLISPLLDCNIITILNLNEGHKYIDNGNGLRTRFLKFHHTHIFKK